MHKKPNETLSDEQVLVIKNFYQVSTDAELIKAMNDHITKIQTSLKAVQPKPYEVPISYRHG